MDCRRRFSPVCWSGLAIAFGGDHAPELSFAELVVLILAWIAWRMIERKTDSIMDRSVTHDAPASGTREPAPRPVADQIAPHAARLESAGRQGLKLPFVARRSWNVGRPFEPEVRTGTGR